MARSYTLKRRAEQQSETRQRIVDATVDLHGRIGPARTTISQIAEHAGVQRHTVYAHFPDERSLFLACSATSFERDPPPDAAAWRDIADPRERLRAGLDAVYHWYERNSELAACVLRDVETHALTQEMFALRFGPAFAAYPEMLGEALDANQRAVLQVALSFHSWRTLAREAGLGRAAAVEVMVRAVAGAGPE
jgi:AcrR family transcriptional regulator